MTKRSLFVAFTGSWLALTMQAAFGLGLPSHPDIPRLPQSDLSRGIWISDGDFVLAPMRFVRFCIDNPDDCKAGGEASIVSLDDQAWRELHNINQKVNARIAPAYESAGRLDWSVTTTYGDCNDYAVQKRHELLSRGWPSSALSLAVVTTATGEGHLILTVRTNRGDIVLDNLRQKIVTWNNTGYRFIKRQSNVSPKYWVEVKGRGGPPDAQVMAISAAEKLVATRDNSGDSTNDFPDRSPNVKSSEQPGAVVEVSVDGTAEVNQVQNPEQDGGL